MRQGFVALSMLAVVAGGCWRGRGKQAPARRPDAAVAIFQPSRPVSPPSLSLPATAAQPPAGPHHGVLRVHLEAEPPHLNPLLDGHQVIQRVTSGLIHEPLVECTSAGYRPVLAESWETAPDGLRLTLKLKEGVRWHDDHPLTGVDAQASLEVLLRSTTRQPALRAMLADVEAVELVSGGIRLVLRRPSGLVLRALCEVPIVPAEMVRGAPGRLAVLARQPIGTGPFRFAGWERGRRIRLSRSGPTGLVDEVVFEIDTDGARALTRTRRGEIDILPRVLDVHYPDQVAPGALRESLRLYRLTPERYSFVVPNHRRAPLDDPRFRRALGLLWNRERLAYEVHRGLARPIAVPPFGESVVPPFDGAEASRLLDDAGYRDTNGDGVRDRNGTAIRLTLLQAAGGRNLAVESHAWALDLRRAGLLLDVVTIDPAVLWTRLRQGDFDLAPLLWDGRPDDDPRPVFGPGAEFNFTGHESPGLAGLFEQLRAAEGPPTRAPILQRIADTLAREQTAIFLYRHEVAALVSRRVHGLAGAGDRLDLRGVWVDP